MKKRAIMVCVVLLLTLAFAFNNTAMAGKNISPIENNNSIYGDIIVPEGGEIIFISEEEGEAIILPDEQVADQSVLDELYEEHLRLRPLKIELTDKERAHALSLGYPEDRIDEITIGEFADLLKYGEIIYPEYNKPYMDMESFESAIKQNQDAYIDSILNDDYEPIENDSLAPIAGGTTCDHSGHIFQYSDATVLLHESQPVHFASSTWPSTIGGISIPKNPTNNSQAFLLRKSLLSDHLYDTELFARSLYDNNTTNLISYYYLFGEEYNSNPCNGQMHEGVDMRKTSGSGTTLKAPIGGRVVKCVTGSSSSLSVLAIYNAIENVTIHFLHLEIDPGISLNSWISPGRTIGKESSRGASQNHCHVQIANGNTTTTHTSTDTTVSCLKPYNFFKDWDYLRLGDVWFDYLVTPEDALDVLQMHVSLIPWTKRALLVGDINGDGKVDHLDAALILRMVVGGYPSTPLDYEEPGAIEESGATMEVSDVAILSNKYDVHEGIFEVTYSITGNTNGFNAFSFDIPYDSNIYTPIDSDIVFTEGSTLPGTFAVNPTYDSNIMRVAYSSTLKFSSDDLLFTVTYQMANGAPAFGDYPLDADVDAARLEIDSSVVNLDWQFNSGTLVVGKMGDIDGNGFISPEDAMVLMQMYVGLIDWTPRALLLGDVNGDGVVDSTDAALIMQMVVGG
jgi:murein DD-endopeptidase MepM/ murein hydrolase activator NlpD